MYGSVSYVSSNKICMVRHCGSVKREIRCAEEVKKRRVSREEGQGCSTRMSSRYTHKGESKGSTRRAQGAIEGHGAGGVHTSATLPGARAGIKVPSNNGLRGAGAGQWVRRRQTTAAVLLGLTKGGRSCSGRDPRAAHSVLGGSAQRAETGISASSSSAA